MEITIEITDAERQALKSRAIAAAEKRLEDELYTKACAEVMADVLKSARAAVKDRIINSVTSYMTDERIKTLVTDIFAGEARRGTLIDVARRASDIMANELAAILKRGLEAKT